MVIQAALSVLTFVRGTLNLKSCPGTAAVLTEHPRLGGVGREGRSVRGQRAAKHVASCSCQANSRADAAEAKLVEAWPCCVARVA